MVQQKKGTSRKIRIGQTVYDVGDLPVFHLGAGQQQVRITDISNRVFEGLLALLRTRHPGVMTRVMDADTVHGLVRAIDRFGIYDDNTRPVRDALHARLLAEARRPPSLRVSVRISSGSTPP